MLQILQVSASFNLEEDLEESMIEEEDVRPMPLILDWVPSFSIFCIWKFCIRLVAAPWRLDWSVEDEMLLSLGRLLLRMRCEYSRRYFWNVSASLANRLLLENSCKHWVMQFLKNMNRSALLLWRLFESSLTMRGNPCVLMSSVKRTRRSDNAL